MEQAALDVEAMASLALSHVRDLGARCSAAEAARAKVGARHAAAAEALAGAREVWGVSGADVHAL